MKKQATLFEPNEQPTHPVLVALVSLAVLLALAVLPRFVMNGHPLIGKEAPDFSLPVIFNGEPNARMRLQDLKGQTILLDFWASWCGPCQLEAPIVDRVAKRYRDRGVVVLGINTGDKLQNAIGFARHKHLAYPVLFDENNGAAEKYDVHTLPTLIVVGKDGKIKSVRVGVVDESTLDGLLAEAM